MPSALRPIAVLTVAALAAISLAACAAATGNGSGAKDSGSYTIGAIFPLSGQQAAFGNTYRDAIDAGTAYVNESGLLDGELKASFADGQANPQASVTSFNKLVNVDGAVAVLSGFSGVMKALAPIANRNEVLVMNGGAASPELRNLGDYVLNNVPLADDQIPQSVAFVAEDRDISDWVVLATNDALGQSMLTSIEKALPNAGGELVGTVTVNSEATDFGSQVLKLRELDPDFIYLAVAGGVVANLTRQIRENGINAQMMSFAGNDSPEVITAPAGEGMLFTGQHLDLDANSKALDFLRSKIENPTTLQINYFNLVLIIQQAIVALEADDADVTGVSIRAKIDEIGTFDVVGGQLFFNSDGTVSQAIDVLQVQGGKSVPIRKFESDECSVEELKC